jgi:hypothetical protein
MGGAAIAQRAEHALPEGHDLAESVFAGSPATGWASPDGQCGQILTYDLMADSLLAQEALKLSRSTPAAT